MTRRPPRYKKILLKVSGEVLTGEGVHTTIAEDPDPAGQ